jgi:hypothetical protein
MILKFKLVVVVEVRKKKLLRGSTSIQKGGRQWGQQQVIPLSMLETSTLLI